MLLQPLLHFSRKLHNKKIIKKLCSFHLRTFNTERIFDIYINGIMIACTFEISVCKYHHVPSST